MNFQGQASFPMEGLERSLANPNRFSTEDCSANWAAVKQRRRPLKLWQKRGPHVPEAKSRHYAPIELQTNLQTNCAAQHDTGQHNAGLPHEKCQTRAHA